MKSSFTVSGSVCNDYQRNFFFNIRKKKKNKSNLYLSLIHVAKSRRQVNSNEFLQKYIGLNASFFLKFKKILIHCQFFSTPLIGNMFSLGLMHEPMPLVSIHPSHNQHLVRISLHMNHILLTIL